MKATIVKLPARYAILVGEGDDAQLLFGNTGYQSSEIASAHGATEIEMGDVKCNLTLTHTSDLELPSPSGSSPPSPGKKRRRSRSS